ncbi:MAG: hypothetical protein JST67_08135 [Bacteroidetes bacterium]|nr:hypothetical protein [Bacteroidota bacterium]
METTNRRENWDEHMKEMQTHHRRRRMAWGFVLFLVGGVFLSEQMGLELPLWLSSWQMLLIALGFFMLLINKFRSFGGFVLILIGTAFLFPGYFIGWHILGPVLAMLFGLKLIFFPSKRFRHRHWHQQQPYKNACVFGNDKTTSDEDTINIDIVFSGFKKNIISKNFKGGNIDCTFGGGELDFSQADINGTAVLNIEATFSGVKLIVPSNWSVRTDGARTVFGDVSDKRKNSQPNIEKTLIINGDITFGGIDIKNY